MNRHNKLVHNIKKHPCKIGLEDILTVSSEVEYYKDGELKGAPDLVFYLNDNSYVLVEVKSSNSEECLQKMYAQVKRAYDFFYENVSENVRSIGVYVTDSGLETIEYLGGLKWN